MLAQTAYLLIIGTHRKGGPHSETAATRNGFGRRKWEKVGDKISAQISNEYTNYDGNLQKEFQYCLKIIEGCLI